MLKVNVFSDKQLVFHYNLSSSSKSFESYL